MIEDELQQLGLVARRHSALTWLDCRHEGGDTTRGESGVFRARRQVGARCSQAASRGCRDRVRIAALACDGS
eukprot:433474-Prymnesium_polylepis.1